MLDPQRVHEIHQFMVACCFAAVLIVLLQAVIVISQIFDRR